MFWFEFIVLELLFGIPSCWVLCSEFQLLEFLPLVHLTGCASVLSARSWLSWLGLLILDYLSWIVADFGINKNGLTDGPYIRILPEMA